MHKPLELERGLLEKRKSVTNERKREKTLDTRPFSSQCHGIKQVRQWLILPSYVCYAVMSRILLMFKVAKALSSLRRKAPDNAGKRARLCKKRNMARLVSKFILLIL
jgi:hypothetical protein